MRQIETIRVEITPSWGEKFPALYRDFKGRGVVATVSLFSKKAHAQVYDFGPKGLALVYGSRVLFNRWIRKIA